MQFKVTKCLLFVTDGFTEEEEIEVDEEGLRPVERGAITYATMQRVPTKLRSRTWTGSEAMDAAAEICSSQSIGNLDAMSLSHKSTAPLHLPRSHVKTLLPFRTLLQHHVTQLHYTEGVLQCLLIAHYQHPELQ